MASFISMYLRWINWWNNDLSQDMVPMLLLNVLVSVVLGLSLWIWMTSNAVKNKKVYWSWALILGFIPMALIYFIVVYIKNDLNEPKDD